MRIAVLGTGEVGRVLAEAFGRIGHDVVVGTRDPVATRQREEWDDVDLDLVPYADAADDADLIVNATSGLGSLEAVERVGQVALAGKIILDVANPLDFSQGFPPTMSVVDTDSLAEQIQRAVPGATVVKALNTVNSSVMVDPSRIGGGDHSVFVAGDDEDAREVVADLLTQLGWVDIVHLPSLDAARGLEMYVGLFLRVAGALGTSAFNIKLVR